MREKPHMQREGGQKKEWTGKEGRNELGMWHGARRFRRVQQWCAVLHSLGFHMLQPLSWWVAYFSSSSHSAFCFLHPSFHRRQECPPSDLFIHALSLILPFILPSLFILIFTLASFHNALTLLVLPSCNSPGTSLANNSNFLLFNVNLDLLLRISLPPKKLVPETTSLLTP